MGNQYYERCERLRKGLQQSCCDAAIAYPGPNLQYFTGFRGEPMDRFHVLYVPVKGDSVMITPSSYVTQVKRNSAVDAIRTVQGNDSELVASEIIELIGEHRCVLVDDDAPHAVTRHLHERLAEDTIRSAGHLFSSLRRQKEHTEIASLRQSARIADAVSAEIRSLGADVVGMTEAELAREIRVGLHERGGTGVSFKIVVASGSNSGDPALRYEDRVIQAGDPVILDFGCFLGGYASDQSRTIVFDGEPPAQFKRAHEAVVTALEAGVNAVHPEVMTGNIDQTVRETLAEYGYAERFPHATGHGVGLAAHEKLVISAGGTVELQPGMVFSIEPGVYFENEFGVRVEDLVTVTEDGVERLNTSPRTWHPLNGTVRE